MPAHEVVLGFGAVNYLAEVYVNGRRVAAHEGGYLGFEVALDADGAVGRQQPRGEGHPAVERPRRVSRPSVPGDPARQAELVRADGRHLAAGLARTPPVAHLGEIILGSDLATGAVGVSVAVSSAAATRRAGRDRHRPRRQHTRTRVDCAGRALVPLGLTVAHPAAWSPTGRTSTR